MVYHLLPNRSHLWDPPSHTKPARLLKAPALWGLIQHTSLEANGVCDQKLQVLLPHRELEAVVPQCWGNFLGKELKENHPYI